MYENSVCHKAYFNKFRINIRPSHLCAGSNEGGKGTCHVSFMRPPAGSISMLTAPASRSTPEGGC